MIDMSAVYDVAGSFSFSGEVVSAERFSGGHINDSWRVTVRNGGGETRYLMQRINDHVFPQPELVMENLERVTGHLTESLNREGALDVARRTLTLVPTKEGTPFHIDPAGGFWRVFLFIERSVSVLRPANEMQAYQAGRAFGAFQRRLGDYAGPELHETIPRFHHTPGRVAILERAIEADAFNRCSRARNEIEAAIAHRNLAGVLLERCARGEIPARIAHNDAKIANVLFDAETGAGLCVVDLDTVMPGLSLYDFGDMARSMTSLAEEDEAGTANVRLSPGLFEAIARGYLEETRGLLTSTEKELLVTAARLITYEQAVRFLTDFLEGDRYYRTIRPDQNLDRCRVQFALLQDFTRSASELMKRIQRL